MCVCVCACVCRSEVMCCQNNKIIIIIQTTTADILNFISWQRRATGICGSNRLGLNYKWRLFSVFKIDWRSANRSWTKWKNKSETEFRLSILWPNCCAGMNRIRSRKPSSVPTTSDTMFSDHTIYDTILSWHWLWVRVWPNRQTTSRPVSIDDCRAIIEQTGYVPLHASCR